MKPKGSLSWDQRRQLGDTEFADSKRKDSGRKRTREDANREQRTRKESTVVILGDAGNNLDNIVLRLRENIATGDAILAKARDYHVSIIT
jgi:hypothetical protein